MTYTEAIQTLERMLDPDPWKDYGLSDKAREALETAIYAMETISDPKRYVLCSMERNRNKRIDPDKAKFDAELAKIILSGDGYRNQKIDILATYYKGEKK